MNLKESFDEINIKLDNILLYQQYLDKKFDNMTKKINEIDNKLIKDTESIQKSLNNMDTHICFIENVYDTIKSPFYFILNKISNIDNIPEKQHLLN